MLLAYALVASGRLSARSAIFHALNVVGAALLLGNSAFSGAWPSVAVNGVWFLIGTIALVLRGTRGRRARPTDDHPHERTYP